MNDKITLTPEKLEATARDYFKDDFEAMWFKFDADFLSIYFVAERNGIAFQETLPLIEWNEHLRHEIMLHHALENLKGNFVRGEQTILLENKKAAN